MRWRKRDLWRAAVVMGGVLFLVLTTLVPVSMAIAHQGVSGSATLATVTVQATPTVNVTATMTALNEEKLRQEIQQLKNQNGNQNNWFANNSTALIAAVATVVVALFGILQWAITVRQAHDKELKDRREERRKEIAAKKKESEDRQVAQEKELKDREDARRKEIAAQDKELRDRAEERFHAAVTALGSANGATQVGGAILLRSFLHKGEEKVYGRYYVQIFDLAVAYLRLPSMNRPSEDPTDPIPLTPLRRALITVFKEVFPLIRNRFKRIPQSLDATGILLDNASLSEDDLKGVWMPESYLRNADLTGAELSNANFEGANLRGAKLHRAKLEEANLWSANLEGADLSWAKVEMRTSTKQNSTKRSLPSRTFLERISP